MSRFIPATLRQRVYGRAGDKCEYCLLPQIGSLISLEVDHIVAFKHGGETEFDNLALACSLCNKYKGSDLTSIDPESGAITPLFHPRRHQWSAHFRIEGAQIEPLTAIGRVTVTLLQLNLPERIVNRELLLIAGVIQVPE